MNNRGRNPWPRLPEELQEKVFALLPVESILHCRGVCRQWRSTLTSSAFLQHWSSVAVSVPWFLMFRDARLRAYSPSLGTWQNIPVTSDDSNLSLVASSGGLIFLSSHHRKSSKPLLIVCNPLALSCRILPNPTTVSLIYVMGMFQCSSSGGYKIMVAGGASSEHKKQLVTEVYDSVTSTWTCQSSVPALEAFQDFSGMRAVWCNGYFYCLSVPPYRLAAYDLRTCRWLSLNVEPPASDLGSASLFVCQDKLMMAAKVMKGKSLKRIQIWELEQHQQPRWSGLQLPVSSSNIVLRKFCRCLTYFMALQRPKGLDSICFNSWCRWRTLMYDVAEKTWHWLPEHSGKFKDMLSGITYEPDWMQPAGTQYLR